VSVCCKEKKKRTKLAFQIERSIRSGEEKQIQARKISQFKSVKALFIAW
jgi:zona occludens toxin (predicted ATPase)